jgi:hypothetical protein
MVSKQRSFHKNNKLRPDRERILDEIGFAWTVDAYRNFKPDDKLWHQQYEKLVEFKRKTGHCIVPSKYKKDKSLGQWSVRSGIFIRRKNFGVIERNFWTKSGSPGNIIPLQPALLPMM